jgi:hypothetical protein
MSRTGIEEARPTKPPKGPQLPAEEEPTKKKPAPSTEHRWKRSLTVAFTSAEIPRRLRDLALEWNLFAPDRTSPAVSYLVEYLLLPRLEAAEAGEIQPPPRGWRAERRSTGGS